MNAAMRVVADEKVERAAENSCSGERCASVFVASSLACEAAAFERSDGVFDATGLREP